MVLHAVQEAHGWIPQEAVEWTAKRLGLSPINIYELVTFYPMYRQAPAGKTHVRVCRTLSCAMAGSYQVMESASAAAGPQLAGAYGRHGEWSTSTRSTTAHAASTASWLVNSDRSPATASPGSRS